MDDDAILIAFDVDIERNIIHYRDLWSTPIIDFLDDEGEIVDADDESAVYAVGRIYSDMGNNEVLVDLEDRAAYDEITRH